MRLVTLAEDRPGERRVAVVPDTVGRLAGLGFDVAVQAGAGAAALATDAAYEAAGASVFPAQEAPSAVAAADVVATVRALPAPLAAALRPGAVSLSLLQPAADPQTVQAVAAAGATLLSFERVPRIARAQPMDALTSQSLVTGYRAALVAADLLPRFFPLFMTAAGTIPPARVLVIGAGVAGLQAIATARRLGAVVSAYDVRPASADEVRSVGATFIDLGLDVIEGAGGYAREMAAERAAMQQELLTPYVAASDVVITTALVPGRPAPQLVSAEMLATMAPGTVAVDLASESGGNIAGSVPGQTVTVGGVTVWGGRDVASQLPVHASRLYAMNVVALAGLLVADGSLAVDADDEIIAAAAVVLAGDVREGV
ncbi:MAG: NAD(P)(+) transhydrogenase (Re/Si-specific) subunit alpha [Actinomycetota bacterium]|nr:MAG: NAD(P)(+) transhydrogenase (Re/Si-specific) subunit alpha [Actinomycetota bacterium]